MITDSEDSRKAEIELNTQTCFTTGGKLPNPFEGLVYRVIRGYDGRLVIAGYKPSDFVGIDAINPTPIAADVVINMHPIKLPFGNGDGLLQMFVDVLNKK